jgi:hypothetical protein
VELWSLKRLKIISTFSFPGCWSVLSPTSPEIIDSIYELILEDRRISAKLIAEQLGISRERVGSIIHEDLDMLAACFLPGRAKDLSASLYYTNIMVIVVNSPYLCNGDSRRLLWGGNWPVKYMLLSCFMGLIKSFKIMCCVSTDCYTQISNTLLCKVYTCMLFNLWDWL